jgi:transketolase
VRAAFRDTLLTLATRDDRVIFLTADLGFGVFDTFIERFPTRYLNVGVAEAQLVDCAAGLALEGWRPIVYSIASFMTGRAWEQIRVAIGYHELPVVVVGAGGGYTYATSGVTHHAKEDLALMALIPGMAVLAPGDPEEVTSLLPQLIDRPGPSYMRIGRFGEPTVASAAPIVVGKGRRLHEGRRVCLVSTGAAMVQMDEAVRLLRERKMPVSAVHFHTLTPFDGEAFDAATASSSTAIVVEDHGSRGGLCAAIADHLVAGGRRMRVVRLGPDDGLVLGNPTPAELQRRLRYDTASIVAVAEEAWRLSPRQAGSEERPAVTA